MQLKERKKLAQIILNPKDMLHLEFCVGITGSVYKNTVENNLTLNNNLTCLTYLTT